MKRRGRSFRYSHDREAAITDLEKLFPWVDRGIIPGLVHEHVNWNGKPKWVEYRRKPFDLNGSLAKIKTINGTKYIDFRSLKWGIESEFGKPCTHCKKEPTYKPYRSNCLDREFYCKDCFEFAGANAWKRGLPRLINELKQAAAGKVDHDNRR